MTEGKTALDIAGKYDVAEGTVRGWLYEYGIRKRKTNINPGTETLERLYLTEGKQAQEIADIYGTTRGTVYP